MAVPNISSRASLNMSGFINSSLRIFDPQVVILNTYRQ